MQQSSSKMNLRSRIGPGLALVLCLGPFISPALAWQPLVSGAERPDFPPPLLVARAEPPAFLAPAPSCQDAEGEPGEEGGITPFLDTHQVLTLLPPPERPAIVTGEGVPWVRPEVTAGVNVDLGTVKFKLGYTLPSRQVDEIVQPLGVDLAPGPDGKCFSLGVKIPF